MEERDVMRKGAREGGDRDKKTERETEREQ